MGELRVANSGGRAEQRSGFFLGSRSSTPPDPASLSEESLSAAEEAAQQVLNCVHPTLDSEEKRRDIVDYVQRLIKSHLNCEVFPYGSVPLKTYLPDGDIDLTALKVPNAEESLPHDVFALLQREEKSENAEYQVKDTQYIDAEVKLVKCLVRNIVIDISFNQLGGLSTLCFLEQVDRLVGRNHLFKRSIILVKAWCYYESRILGAHHGLISTYALETLILYIFHLYHSSLSGPLAVLYRFLDYYSQFDWENYCISLKGPACKSSLPDIVVETPESGWNNLMLSEEFLENCIEMFSVSSRTPEGNPKAFQAKHLNIIDPLKENNNLGRSVHRGNFYRIRSAFKYGARKLGQVLLQPRDKVANGICDFFTNTLARHGNDFRSSFQCLTLESGDEESSTASLSSPVELLSEDDMLLKSSASDADKGSVRFELKNETDRYLTIELPSEMASGYSAEGVISGHHIAGETYDLVTSNSSLRNGTSDYASSSDYTSSVSWNHCHESLYSGISAEIGQLRTGTFHQSGLATTASLKFGISSWLKYIEENGKISSTYQWCMDNSHDGCLTGLGSSIPKANILDNLSLEFREMDLTSLGGESEAFNPLADLSGDYDSHIRSLLYGQLCHGFSLFTSEVCHTPSFPSRLLNKKPWDIVRQSMPFWRSQFSKVSSRPVSVEQSRRLAADSAFSSSAFRSEGMHKTRGTGTYFPHVGFYREKSLQGRSRYKALGNPNQFHRYGRCNGLYPALGTPSYFGNGIHEVLPARSKSKSRGRLDVQCQSPRSVGDGNQASGDLNGSCRIEFGSVGNLGEEVISTSAHVCGSALGVSLETQCTKKLMKQERVPGPSIHLKNEVDFPPLCQ
ncbi:uncharacterized protein LOC105163859 isoform X2 [Sesamum indicum]|uniref:Uncharacterized protein LOC105163859 isoform X2 n=1 Tax=Sesamum indicum TaxID=4182 RepID=A0A8M8V222_SESIN|nr:uncharacterized protein LOC105163859 isoform X2 [Sesamum indicum]